MHLSCAGRLVPATPRSDDLGECPWLADVPQLSDDVARLAGRDQLSPAQEAFVAAQVAQVAIRLRMARRKYAA